MGNPDLERKKKVKKLQNNAQEIQGPLPEITGS